MCVYKACLRALHFNVQFYDDYSLTSYDNVISNGYDSKQIVMGTMNYDVLNIIKVVNNKYKKKFGGVYLWEYMFALPNGCSWAQSVKDIINPSFIYILLSYLSFWNYLKVSF